MCLIIHGPANDMRRVLLGTAGLIESILHKNPDGIGIMFKEDNGEPAVIRYLNTTVANLRADLAHLLPTDDRLVTLHARYATHGGVDTDNCHPYFVDGGWLMHNGVLAIDTSSDPRMSDTWHYCRKYLDTTAHALFRTPQGRALLADVVGHGNTFVFMSKDGETHIAGRERGVTYEGLWFSNTYAWDVGLLDRKWGRRQHSLPPITPNQLANEIETWGIAAVLSAWTIEFGTSTVADPSRTDDFAIVCGELTKGYATARLEELAERHGAAFIAMAILYGLQWGRHGEPA